MKRIIGLKAAQRRSILAVTLMIKKHVADICIFKRTISRTGLVITSASRCSATQSGINQQRDQKQKQIREDQEKEELFQKEKREEKRRREKDEREKASEKEEKRKKKKT